MAIETQNGDYDLTSAVTIYSKVADAATAGQWVLDLEIGDGSKNLNTAESVLEYAVTGASQTYPTVSVVKESGTLRAGKTLGPYSIADGETLSVTLASTNASDTDVDATVTPRRLAADVTAISGDSTAANNLEAAYDGTGYSFQNQQISREAYGVSGTVWHVKYDASETMGNDGLSWETAKKTAGAGVKTVIEAASAGDLVLIGAGTFTIGNAVINTPDGVSIEGAGKDATRITSTAENAAIVQPPSGAIIRSLTIEGLNDNGTYQMPLGSIESAGQSAFTNSRAENIRLIADADGLYVNHSGVCSLVLYNCEVETKFDCVYLQGNASHTLFMDQVTLRSDGPSSIASSSGRAIMSIGSIINGVNCNLWAKNADQSSYGIFATGGTITLRGGSIYGEDYVAYNNVGATITLMGVEYDRTKLYGAVSDNARIKTGTDGYAQSDVKEVKGVDADTAISSRVNASQIGLDWADGGRLDAILDSRSSSSEVLAIQNNTRVRVIIPAMIERPDSDSTTYRLDLYIYDEAGNMESPDSTPTITAANQAGTDRSANLGSVTEQATGHYSVTYAVASDHAIEQVRFEWSIVEGGVTRLHGGLAQVVDTTAVDFTAADRTKLEAVHTKLPSRDYLAGSAAATGETQTDAAAALTAYDPPTNTEMEARTKLAAEYADKTTLDTIAGDVANIDGEAMPGTPPTAEQNASQVRTELTTELSRLDATISSRHASGAAVAKSPATLDWDGDVTNKPTIGTSTLTTSDIPTANAIASAVWAATTRTLTSFGSLVSLIWAAASRTLTGSSSTHVVAAAEGDVPAYTAITAGNTATYYGRLKDSSGDDITQAGVSSIAYTIYPINPDDPKNYLRETPVTGHSAIDLTVADVVWDTVQIDSAATNYNFRHAPVITTNAAFPTVGVTYVVRYTIARAIGQPIYRQHRVKVT